MVLKGDLLVIHLCAKASGINRRKVFLKGVGTDLKRPLQVVCSLQVTPSGGQICN